MFAADGTRSQNPTTKPGPPAASNSPLRCRRSTTVTVSIGWFSSYRRLMAPKIVRWAGT